MFNRLSSRHLIALAALIAFVSIALLYTPRASRPTKTSAEHSEPIAATPDEPGAAAPKPATPMHAATGERNAEVLSARSIESIANLIRDHITRSPRYAELANCDPVVSSACRDLLSQAIYEAMDVKVLPQTLSGGLGLKDISKHDADAIFAAAGRVLLDSKDSVERASALLLLRSVPSLPLRPLPEAAYQNLANRTVAEAQLTLQQPIGGPMPYPEVARELVSLFTDDRDSRLQDTALTALAHPETEVELLAAVRETARRHGPEWPDWLSSVGPAIGTCGMACLQTVEAVLDASGDNPEVAEEILRAFPETERVALTENMKSRFEPKQLFALATSAGVELPATP